MLPMPTPMTIIMTLIVLIIGYVALTQAVNHIISESYYAADNSLLINIVLGIMYIILCGFVGLLYVYAGYDMNVIYFAMALIMLVLLVTFIRMCITHWYDMSVLHLILFLVYMAVVLYGTIFMRIGVVEDNTIVMTPFDDLQRAITEGDPMMAEHMLLNILMFVPFGYLIPAMNREAFGQWSFAMLGGLLVSTAVEGTQMVMRIGEADVDDLIANTLGAVLGYLVVRFLWQFRKNWQV